MALYPCPECSREISTDANTCPHCGKNLVFSKSGASFRALPKFGQRFVLGAFGISALILLAVAMLPDKPAPSVSAPAVQQPPALANGGRLTVQPGQWFGFRDREALDRETKLAVQGDKDAWAKSMAKIMTAGGLTQLKPGEEVYVEDTAMMSGAVKIRRKGETTSWWTSFEAVK